MKIPREKRCRVCGTQEDLVLGSKYKGVPYVQNICRTCCNERYRIRAAHKIQDWCSRCYEKKPATKAPYCSKCNNRSQKFRATTDDFKIELYLYVKQIIRRGYKLYELDLFKIADYWADVSYNVHLYWPKNPEDQLNLMFKDLIEYLKWSEIKKKKKIHNGQEKI